MTGNSLKSKKTQEKMSAPCGEINSITQKRWRLMKRIIFFLILMISMTAAAQDAYRPLLKDGKVWHEVSFPGSYGAKSF